MVNAVLIGIHVLSSLILILFVLLHAGRGGGLSDMFGGVGGGTLAGSTVVETNLDRMTVMRVARVHVHDGLALAATDLTGHRQQLRRITVSVPRPITGADPRGRRGGLISCEASVAWLLRLFAL